MKNKKLLQKLLVTSLAIESLTFTPQIYLGDFPLVSIAHADYETIDIERGAIATQMFDEAHKFAEQNNYNEAVKYYTKAIQFYPNYLEAYNDRGFAYSKLKNYSKAIEDYTKAIQIDPNIAVIYYNRGIVYSKLENYSQAVNPHPTKVGRFLVPFKETDCLSTIRFKLRYLLPKLQVPHLN